MHFWVQIPRDCKVLLKRLTDGGGGIFNNKLLLSLLFPGNFCGVEKALIEGDKVVMGDPPVPHLGKPWTEKLNFSPKGPRTVKL